MAELAETDRDDLLVGLLSQLLDRADELLEDFAGPPLRFKAIATAASGATTIVGEVVGRIQVVSYVLVAKTAVDVVWRSGARDISGTLGFAAGGGLSAAAGSRRDPLFETDPGEELVLNLSAAATVGGHLAYTEAFERG